MSDLRLFGTGLATIAALCACSGSVPGTEAASDSPATVSIMTFNVENLFDNLDDPGKDDSTYFALDRKQSDEHIAACEKIEVKYWREQCLYWDWSDAIVAAKLTAIAEVILQVDGGRGPDVIALQEIENISILERLREEFLAGKGYLPAILIEGNDLRGVDVALLSKLPQSGEAALHDITFDDDYAEREADTRGILEATFELPDGALLTGYVVHFPAPYHPTEMRISAYNRLNSLRSALPPDRYVFAAGDFNTTSKEDSEQNLLQRFARPDWTVVHETGCSECAGSYYYSRDSTWSFLDMILWSPAEKRGADATWSLRVDSAVIVNGIAKQVTNRGTPRRFDIENGDGVSDHWPLLFRIDLK